MLKLNYRLCRRTLFVLLAGVVAFSCAKKTSSPSATSTTQNQAKLEINVLISDGQGQPAPNPKVQLFLSDADRANKTNPATNLRTGDANGNVNFDSLQPVVYYFNAYSNDMTQTNAGLSNSTYKLVNGQLNKLQTGVK